MINWRDAATNPPTRDESTTTGFVVIQDRREQCGFRGVHLDQVRASDKWCQHRDIKAIIEATFEQQPDSMWVFAKDRMPTKDDGDFVLWMCDEYQRPVVLRIEHFGQSASTKTNNLRWCRIPTCPPPPKRELPAVAPETFPAFVTLRNGEHAIATRRCPGEHSTTILGCKSINGRFGSEVAWWYVATGRALENELSNLDIVHVGGWLTKEELEIEQ